MHIVGWGRGVVDAWAARTVEVEPRTGVGSGCIAAVGAAAVAGGIAAVGAVVVGAGSRAVAAAVVVVVVVVVVAGGRALVVEHFGTSTVGVLLDGTVALRCNSLG